jgi:hypothetical protein
MLIFMCPKCGTKLSAPPEWAGRVTNCKCGQAIQLPKPGVIAAPSQATRDKTALGDRVSHVPTGLANADAKRENMQDKTTLGKIVAHNPTAIQPPGKKQSGGDPNHPLVGIPLSDDPAIHRQVSWFSGALILTLVFLGTGTLVGGLIFFFRAKETQPQLVANKDESKNSVSLESNKNPLPKDRDDQKKDLPIQNNTTAPDAENEPVIAKKESLPEEKIAPSLPKEERPPEKEAPPAKKEPPPQPKSEATELSALIGALRTGSDDQKLNAAGRLASMGETAAPASRALCELTLSSNKDVARKALLLLEKVNPRIHGPVFTLAVDGKATNHLMAGATLRQMGAQAKPASAILIRQVRKRMADMKQPGFNQPSFNFNNQGGWENQVVLSVTLEHLVTLAAIAPDETECVQTIVECATLRLQTAAFFQINGQLTSFRQASVSLLGGIAAHHPEHHKIILAALEGLLDESVRNISGNNLNEFQIAAGLKDVDQVATSILKCGKQANETLTKKVVPQLQELEFHKDESVRSTAKNLRTRIEAAAGK